MRAQSEEEWAQGLRVFDHLAARQIPIERGAIERSEIWYGDPEAVDNAAVSPEQGATRCINALYVLAVERGVFHAKALMDWCVNEQIE